MSESIDDLRAAIAKIGPVAVTINADPDSFTFYANGIYYDPACSKFSQKIALIIQIIDNFF